MAISDGLQLTFDENFDRFDASPDGTQTTLADGTFRRLASNNDQGFYSDASVGADPFTIQNGTLTISAGPGTNSLSLPYNTGEVNTSRSFSQEYGYFEWRAQLPAGKGLWPSLWLLPSDGSFPPEIDAAEVLGDNPSKIYFTVHSEATGSYVATGTAYSGIDTSNGFHTYGVNWTPTVIDFYIDGQMLAELATPADMHKPMYMITSLGVGGYWSGNPDSTTPFPADMQVDYMRAYANQYTQDVSLNEAAAATTASATGTPSPPVSTTHDPVQLSVGSGTVLATLSLSQDYYTENAQYVVMIDGREVGSTLAASALHGQGSDTVTVHGEVNAGRHEISVEFLNDASGTAANTDRNLHLDSAQDASGQTVAISGTAQDGAMYATGQFAHVYVDVPADASAGTQPAHSPLAIDVGTGPIAFTLHIAQDNYGDDAQYAIKVDGQQIGGTLTASALRGQGSDTVTVHGDFGPGHDVTVQFLNDAYGGSATTDRNLFVTGADDASGNPLNVTGYALLASTDVAHLTTTGPSSTTPGNPVPAQTNLVLHMSEDAWQGDAQFTLTVDGVQQGGTQTVTALHSQGQNQDFVFSGPWTSGEHTIGLSFINDAFSGAGQDRNLYLDSFDAGTQHGVGATLFSNQTVTFDHVTFG